MACSIAHAATGVQTRTQAFVEAYVRGDFQAVQRMIDSREISMYGSDVTEIVHGADGVQHLMMLDQKVWGGAARVGQMQRVSVVEGEEMATVFFDLPFISVAERFHFAVQLYGANAKVFGRSFRA
jgi:hypothetical protein